MSRSALIPHPEYSVIDLLPPQPEITDEHVAMRLGAGYRDGAYMAIERIARALLLPVPHSLSRHWLEADNALHRAYEPDYAEIRDYLIHENNVAPLLAQRVALRLTRRIDVRTH